ncbi:sensor histidine kinase [uncultured Tateyamaria sp.]|uniref:sensor histidine kinase n=1 Tax=uncultured Tateyamaria sp. TaxID=455651 RepID=UPI0026141067|nr:sensor histidine kinase [uncultured Tateyamaria sp.]
MALLLENALNHRKNLLSRVALTHCYLNESSKFLKKSRLNLPEETDIKNALTLELAKPDPDPKRIAELSDALLDEATGSVRFTVDAQHINRLGYELVGKQETALSELIKNAYDADATSVEIEFEDYDKVGGNLIVTDNGAGMDAQTIRNSWMRLSTNDKGDNPVSERFKRLRAGRKGIGRFAVQRLGKSLILETEQAGKDQGIRVVFHWDSDFTAGTNLNQVWHEVETYDKEPDASGTTLKIHDLRDRWTKSTIERVWKSVLFLQPPFDTDAATNTNASDFSVSINGVTSRQQSIELNIEEAFLNNAIATIEGSIDDKGKATFRVASEKLDLDETHQSDISFLIAGAVNLKTHYFIYTPDAMSGMSVKLASDMGHKYGGLRVYRNGFRVLPYGEPHDDWLKLARDAARRNLLVPANNSNFFGHVSIDKDASPLLEETSSREGFIENEAFEELQAFCRRCVEWAATRVASARKRKTSASQPDFEPTYTRKPSEIIREHIEHKNKGSNGDSEDEGGNQNTSGDNGDKHDDDTAFLEHLLSKQEKFEETVDERLGQSVEYENMLRILASLGISISLFGHEIKSASAAVDNSLAVAEIDAEKLKNDSERLQIETDLASLQSATNRIFDLGSYVESLVSKTRSRELTPVHVDTAVRHFLKQFQSYLQKRHIEFDVEIEPIDLLTPEMHASELDSALFNFLTNSVKAIEKTNTNKPKIRVSGRSEGEFTVISFEDNGVGVPEEVRDRVFEAFFTTTETDGDSISGIGTGLGLQIVSDIASAYGGSVALSDNPTDGYTTRFDLKLRKNTKS